MTDDPHVISITTDTAATITLLQAKNSIGIPGVREKMRDRKTLENGVGDN